MDRAAFRDRDARIRTSNLSAARLAAEHGITVANVHRIRRSAPRTSTRKERYQLDVVRGGWAAACMEPDEWAGWVQRNPVHSVADGMFADRPCRDCPLGFAADMRAVSRCNGSPGAVGGRHEADEEDEDVIDSRPGGVRGTATPLALTLPPCDTCAHEPICVLKIALKKATSVDVTPLQLPDGLSVQVSAVVDCRFYSRVRASGGTRTGSWTPERRAAQSERLKAVLGARKAAGA